jgi:alpha/beta superfamily hydrolase
VYDEGRGEREDALAAVDLLARELPGLPLLLGGFSFGAATALRAGPRDERVKALLLMGLPVGVFPDLGGEDGGGRAVLFVQGERDEFGDARAIERFAASFPEPKRLVIVPGSDHLFTGRADDVARAVTEWVRSGALERL